MAHALCLGRASVVSSVGSSDSWPSGKRQGRQGKAGEVGKVDRLPRCQRARSARRSLWSCTAKRTSDSLRRHRLNYTQGTTPRRKPGGLGTRPSAGRGGGPQNGLMPFFEGFNIGNPQKLVPQWEALLTDRVGC